MNILRINNEITFTLNNSLAATSATLNSDEIVAVDGINCLFHRLNQCGDYLCSESALRNYRRLRRGTENSYTALACCEQARVYFLDRALNEFCFVTLDADDGCGYTCSCGCEDFRELTDASVTSIGSEQFIIGAFRKSAFLFDINGKRLSKLCEADRNEILTDFIQVAPETYAMGTLRGDVTTVTVSENGIAKSAILERGHTLRMLFSNESGEIFGLFGKNYIYNKIVKIYSGGILTLPESKGCAGR